MPAEGVSVVAYGPSQRAWGGQSAWLGLGRAGPGCAPVGFEAGGVGLGWFGLGFVGLGCAA
eukprot:8794321-Alexandrium_andersonii.AAC.1